MIIDEKEIENYFTVKNVLTPYSEIIRSKFLDPFLRS